MQLDIFFVIIHNFPEEFFVTVQYKIESWKKFNGNIFILFQALSMSNI